MQKYLAQNQSSPNGALSIVLAIERRPFKMDRFYEDAAKANI
jgi:hypothetical protein